VAEPWEWVESDLQNLLRDRVGESTVLDYKACEALVNSDKNKLDIGKDVSAFANSAGGTVVYGIDERGHIPIAIRGVDPSVTTREWIEQTINSGIQRRIDGIRIKQVALDTVDPGRVAYVVSIPQSLRAPHMAADHKFYKRFNFQSVPMEEYEVRDVARRFEAPDLWIEFDLWPDPNAAPIEFAEQAGFSSPVQMVSNIVNRSVTLAQYALISLGIDARLRPAHAIGRLSADDMQLEVGNGVAQCKRYTLNWSPVGMMPVWEGVSLRLDQEFLSVMFPRTPGNYYLGWYVRSPGMMEHSGTVTLVSDGFRVVMR
jgi:hypothetical protein